MSANDSRAALTCTTELGDLALCPCSDARCCKCAHTRRVAYGAERRAILTHSPELRESQARGFDGTTLAKSGKKLDELAATLARGRTRRARDKVEAEITSITGKPWVRRVIRWELTGDQPKDLRLT